MALPFIVAIVSLLVGPPGLTDAQHSSHARQAMGFDQEKTTHHFLIERAGGTIEVTAKDATDTTSVEQIRPHLRHIAAAFSKGDFALPMFVHGEEPPGVPALKQQQKALTYKYEELPHGGRVVIRTSDKAALSALHDFLRYQIREHRTGDPMDPK
jgi:hypothetical protein